MGEGSCNFQVRQVKDGEWKGERGPAFPMMCTALPQATEQP